MTATTTHTPSRTGRSAGASRRPAVSALFGFVAGGFFANGVPHTVLGLMGMEHTSPLGESAGMNLLWGAINLALGVGLALPKAARHSFVAFAIAVGAGALGTAVSLIALWS